MQAQSRTRTARIILLNGVGSVGKTSTARALQAIASTPLLLVAMDAFIDMLPPAMIGDPQGLLFEPVADPAGPSLAVRSGPVVERTMNGMRHAIAAMAEAGNDLIVDEVLLGRGEVAAYRSLLAAFDLRVVGLFASLEILEARERARGDRAIGLARWQFDRVHQGVAYDLEIDTAASTPEDTARTIRDAFRL
jgi:chloramphenicol 3-O phosphotransferase